MAVAWILQMEIKPGELENWKALMAEMVAAIERDEPGVEAYEWFIDDAGSMCHLYERYADSAAVMTHLGIFGEKYAGRFMGAAEARGMTVYGDPDETVQKALSGMGARFLGTLGGFAR